MPRPKTRPKTPPPAATALTYDQVSIRFPKDIMATCRTIAAEEDRSLNEQLLHVVKAWLAAQGRTSRESAPRTP